MTHNRPFPPAEDPFCRQPSTLTASTTETDALLSVSATKESSTAATEVATTRITVTPRDYLANERTFLAWMRTALALMGVGLALWRVAASNNNYNHTLLAGNTALALGAVTLILATVRYFHVLRLLRDEARFEPNVGPLLTLVALILGVLGVLAYTTMASFRW